MSLPRLVDIGANLTDPMFRGIYRGKSYHPSDLSAVLDRAWSHGLHRIMVTAGSLEESREAVEFVKGPPFGDARLSCTVGVHPTRATECEENPDAHFDALEAIVREANGGSGVGGTGVETGDDRGDGDGGRRVVVAVGECGLDFDRLEFCPRDVQERHFRRHLVLADKLSLPLFLHNRSSTERFAQIISEHIASRDAGSDKCTDNNNDNNDNDNNNNNHNNHNNNNGHSNDDGVDGNGVLRGVAHSFTGTPEEMRELLLPLGLHIGLNGCSLRTEDGLRVAREVPLDMLLIETDAPWCSIKRTHPSFPLVQTPFETVKQPKRWEEGKGVRDRCEPAHIVQVAEVIAGVRGVPVEEIAAATTENARRLFFPGEVWE